MENIKIKKYKDNEMVTMTLQSYEELKLEIAKANLETTKKIKEVNGLSERLIKLTETKNKILDEFILFIAKQDRIFFDEAGKIQEFSLRDMPNCISEESIEQAYKKLKEQNNDENK